VSFAAITLCVASQRVRIVVSTYFVIESVRKLLDTPSYVDGTSFESQLNFRRLGPFVFFVPRQIKGQVNLSLYLTKYHVMKTYPVLN